jgi:hypothetical protein
MINGLEESDVSHLGSGLKNVRIDILNGNWCGLRGNFHAYVTDTL